MATGVLPVFVGGATKAVDLVPDDSKSYRAGFRLGFVSDTQDIWGELRSRCENGISEDEMRFALDDFRGDIMQVPPMILRAEGQRAEALRSGAPRYRSGAQAAPRDDIPPGAGQL